MDSSDSDSEIEESGQNSVAPGPSKLNAKSKLPPLTTFEKELLLELVKKYNSMIESKETDFGSRRKKKDAWKSLSASYCASAGISGNRNAKQLKKSWENAKRSAKKEVVSYKKAVRATGGGPKPKDPTANTMKVVSLISAQINPIENPFDSYAMVDHNFEFSTIEDSSQIPDMNGSDVADTPRQTVKEKRKYQDVRSYLADMEFEEHKLRLKILAEDLEASKLKRRCAAEQLKCEEWNAMKARLQYESNIGHNNDTSVTNA